jgi:peptide/nickel transport system substrate-binding protein
VPAGRDPAAKDAFPMIWSCCDGDPRRAAPPGATRGARLAVVVVVAAGCVGRPEPLPTGVVAVMEAEQTATFVRNFNPLLEVGASRWPTRRAMYEPLMIHNPLTGAYVPWLAERYEPSADRTRLRFVLRPGIRWSDGAPFSGRDVVFTFQLLRRFPALDARRLWDHVRAVELADPSTPDVIDVVLTQPHAPLLEEIAQQAIVPAHVWGKISDPVGFANESPVATGPFTEVNFFGVQAYEIGRNPYYWRPGQPAAQALRFRAYPANEPATLALLHDEVDWAGMFLPAIERIFEAPDPAHHRHWFPSLDATVLLYANTQRAPFDDVRARKALSMAIDRPRIVATAMHGYTHPADGTGLSDAYARYRDADAVAAGAAWMTYDEAAAGRLFDQAGLLRGSDGIRRTHAGQPIAVTLDVPAGFSDWIAAAEIMARAFRRVGLAVAVRASEYSAWFEKLESGSFQLAMAWSDLNATPYGFYRSLMATSTVKPIGEPSAENWHRFGLDAADRQLAAVEAARDDETERAAVVELERLFAAHAPALPLFPGPLWGEFNSARIVGFPSADDPYAPLSPNIDGPQPLLVLTRIAPR